MQITQKAPKSCLSWFVVLITSLSACKTGPLVTIGISHPEEGGLSCYNPRTDESYLLKYADSDKWICLPPEDARTLFQYCNRKGQ